MNVGSEDSPVQTEVHRDVKSSLFGVSCVYPFGTFIRGALILWELELIVELGLGDLFFFPDALIHHSNERAEGLRHSLIAFTHQNVLDYLKQGKPFVPKIKVRLKRVQKKLKEQLAKKVRTISDNTVEKRQYRKKKLRVESRK